MTATTHDTNPGCPVTITVITDRPQNGRGDAYVRVLEGQALPPRGTIPGDAPDADGVPPPGQ